MKSSYANPRNVVLSIDLELDEMETLITSLEKRVESGENDWSAKDLLKSLKSSKAESVRQLRESLKNYA
tara:strand:+ start:266 stop:472 length:207 start_codon:yes stop_codon:yes gene_type:complete